MFFGKPYEDLNTSHVNVNLDVMTKVDDTVLNLNTSHVNVNPLYFKVICITESIFKYISC